MEQEVQTVSTEIQGFTMATEAVVSVGTMTEEVEESTGLKELLNQLEKGRAELQETLSHKEWASEQQHDDDDNNDSAQFVFKLQKELNIYVSFSGTRRQPLLFTYSMNCSLMIWFCFVFSDELRQLRTEKEDLQKETECWKAEQIKERDQENQQHKCVLVGIQPILDICWIYMCHLVD